MAACRFILTADPQPPRHEAKTIASASSYTGNVDAGPRDDQGGRPPAPASTNQSVPIRAPRRRHHDYGAVDEVWRPLAEGSAPGKLASVDHGTPECVLARDAG